MECIYKHVLIYVIKTDVCIRPSYKPHCGLCRVLFFLSFKGKSLFLMIFLLFLFCDYMIPRLMYDIFNTKINAYAPECHLVPHQLW